jgi:hypothetical protein
MHKCIVKNNFKIYIKIDITVHHTYTNKYLITYAATPPN